MRFWQDLYSTGPTHSTCPRSCRFYSSHPATWAKSYRSYRSYRSWYARCVKRCLLLTSECYAMVCTVDGAKTMETPCELPEASAATTVKLPSSITSKCLFCGFWPKDMTRNTPPSQHTATCVCTFRQGPQVDSSNHPAAPVPGDRLQYSTFAYSVRSCAWIACCCC